MKKSSSWVEVIAGCPTSLENAPKYPNDPESHEDLRKLTCLDCKWTVDVVNHYSGEVMVRKFWDDVKWHVDHCPFKPV